MWRNSEQTAHNRYVLFRKILHKQIYTVVHYTNIVVIVPSYSTGVQWLLIHDVCVCDFCGCCHVQLESRRGRGRDSDRQEEAAVISTSTALKQTSINICGDYVRFPQQGFPVYLYPRLIQTPGSNLFQLWAGNI